MGKKTSNIIYVNTVPKSFLIRSSVFCLGIFFSSLRRRNFVIVFFSSLFCSWLFSPCVVFIAPQACFTSLCTCDRACQLFTQALKDQTTRHCGQLLTDMSWQMKANNVDQEEEIVFFLFANENSIFRRIGVLFGLLLALFLCCMKANTAKCPLSSL